MQEEVLDFVEFLLQKAEAIERWAKSKAPETPVILDDRREIIYEDWPNVKSGLPESKMREI